ncbi:hypothetical protein FOA52_000116 [Chlamydomonas sp. UWO 241]|nr:hypothetical protein FOA52_000116 [Chlamydomonas sp. UWO 241]
MMFCLGREEFPVDTHVLHICTRLGWLPAGASREAAYEHLNRTVPGHLKYDLHVLMVQHGKACGACAKVARKGMAGAQACPLTRHCGRAGAAAERAPEAPLPAATTAADCSGAAPGGSISGRGAGHHAPPAPPATGATGACGGVAAGAEGAGGGGSGRGAGAGRCAVSAVPSELPPPEPLLEAKPVVKVEVAVKVEAGDASQAGQPQGPARGSRPRPSAPPAQPQPVARVKSEAGVMKEEEEEGSACCRDTRVKKEEQGGGDGVEEGGVEGAGGGGGARVQ